MLRTRRDSGRNIGLERCRDGSCPPQANTYFAMADFKAFASWSGQDVFLAPQRIPSMRWMASLTSIPSMRRATPWAFPAQPPTNSTFVTLLSTISKLMRREQTPDVLYCMINPSDTVYEERGMIRPKEEGSMCCNFNEDLFCDIICWYEIKVFKEIDSLIDSKTKIVYTTSGYKSSIKRYSEMAESKNILFLKRMIRMCR